MHPRAAALQISGHPARRRAQNRVFRAQIVSNSPQMAGFFGDALGVIGKAGAAVGAAVGGIVGGAAGAQKGAEIGGKVAAIANAIKDATGQAPGPEAEAAAAEVLEDGGTMEDAKRAALRVVAERVSAQARMAQTFAGDNSGVRSLLVSKKTGLPVPPKPAISPAGYTTRALNVGAGSQTSAAITPSAGGGLPPWAMYAGGAVLAGGLVYLVTRKGGR